MSIRITLTLLFLSLLALTCTVKEGKAPISIIPIPQSMEVGDEFFVLKKETIIETSSGEDWQYVGFYLKEKLDAALLRPGRIDL